MDNYVPLQTTLKVGEENKTNKVNKQKKKAVVLVLLIFIVLIATAIIIIFVVENGTEKKSDDSNSTESTLPTPGIPYQFLHHGKLQNITLNEKVLYYKNETSVKCVVDFDEDGSLSNLSYIQLFDDFTGRYKVDSILLAGAPSFADLDRNCTMFPAVIITKIINDTINSLLTLYVREAELFDYFDELDCNITNATSYDTGIDMGDIKKLKNLEKYFSNSTTTNTNTTIIFSNVTYYELEYLCYNVTENGTILNNISVIDGICDGLSAIDYFGTLNGFDALEFENYTIGQNGTNFSFSPDDVSSESTTRRRLHHHHHFFHKIVDKVKKVVHIVKDTVKTVVDILKGNINKKILDEKISIDRNKAFSISGNSGEWKLYKKDDVSGSVDGKFSIKSGIDFDSEVYVDLIAKYKIFSKHPHFDYFELKVGGKSSFKVYVDIAVNGKVDIKVELAHVEKRKIFFLGPIPIIIKPYATVSVGFESEDAININALYGYKPIYIEYGIKWDGKGGWETIKNDQLKFIPYKNFGGNTDGKCVKFSVDPYIELELGIVFYGFLDVSIIPTIYIKTTLQFPATCDHIDACDHSPLQTKFNMEFEFKLQIGLSVGISKTDLPKIGKRFDLPFADISANLFDKCFDTKIPDMNQLCCPAT